MRLKKSVAIVLMFSMLIGVCGISFADPTEDFHTGPLPGQKEEGGATGPEVVEYYDYDKHTDKTYAPGSLMGDVDLSAVGRGLFYDGQDFYYFLDTGVMATNFMYTIEGDRFFFDENGRMVRDQLVSYNDELYYFDINGAMYKNRWYSDEQIDESDNTIHYTDYYFGPTGRAYRALSGGIGLTVKTIDGEKYGFNVDGEKLEGYYDQNGVEQDPDEVPAYEDCMYYFDPENNGAACKGWHYYEGAERGTDYDENEELVLYFDEKTCRKVAARVTASDSNRAVSRIIDGQRYMFDNNGIRKNTWYMNEPGRASQSNMKYFSEEYDGYLQKGWFKAVPGAYAKEGEDLILDVNKERHKNDEEMWFYASSNGNILKKTIRKIGSYTYAFDDDGVMQQDAFVKVRNGSFIKAYETEQLYRFNVLLDPNETGGNADPNPEGVTHLVNIDRDKGLLEANKGERWMYFHGDAHGDDMLGSLAKKNSQVEIELNDRSVFYVANSLGGYTNYDRDTNITTIVQRNGKYIQNGMLLKPDPDDNNYGIVRRYPTLQEVEEGSVLNYKNEVVRNISTKGPTNNGKFYRFEVVDSKGSPVTGQNKSFKDKNGNYIYIGVGGQFLGYYGYEGRFYAKTPSNLVDKNDERVPASNNPCWAYKMPDEKQWVYGLPDEDARISVDSLFINFTPKSSFGSGSDFGPYTAGIASLVYDEND